MSVSGIMAARSSILVETNLSTRESDKMFQIAKAVALAVLAGFAVIFCVTCVQGIGNGVFQILEGNFDPLVNLVGLAIIGGIALIVYDR